jgi:hypothetical protein
MKASRCAHSTLLAMLSALCRWRIVDGAAAADFWNR